MRVALIRADADFADSVFQWLADEGLVVRRFATLGDWLAERSAATDLLVSCAALNAGERERVTAVQQEAQGGAGRKPVLIDIGSVGEGARLSWPLRRRVLLETVRTARAEAT